MFKKYKLLIPGLLCIAYAVGKSLLLMYIEDHTLARVRALEPQRPAALRSLPPGAPVLVEGHVSRSNPRVRGWLVAYVRTVPERYAEREEPIWIPDSWISPPLVLNVGSETVTLESDYQIMESTRQQMEKNAIYNGFERDAKVFAVGRMTSTGTIKAETVCGGTRANFLLKHTGEKWVGYLHSLFIAGLGLFLIAIEVFLGPRRAARQQTAGA